VLVGVAAHPGYTLVIFGCAPPFVKGQYQATGSVLVVASGKMEAILAFEPAHEHQQRFRFSRNCRRR
jgi:hypothetical protein